MSAVPDWPEWTCPSCNAVHSLEGPFIAHSIRCMKCKQVFALRVDPRPAVEGDPCPWCGEELRLHADVCRRCGRDPLTPPVTINPD